MRRVACPKPTVTVAIAVLNEERHIAPCLDAVARQTYEGIVEVLVIDGGSSDMTREVVAAREGVTLLSNPRRIQSCALNLALARARGDIFVRIDGHCLVAPDYVERCVDALARTGAAIVGGAMRVEAAGALQRGIAGAMRSRLGAGPARFHLGGASGWVDTVYLGAYPTKLALACGGYAEDLAVNEDAEFAYRMRRHGGIWLDEAIRSTYTPRSSLIGLGRQFFRYGRFRAATVRRHPGSLAPRQLAAPALVLGLASPWRASVAAAYLSVVGTRSIVLARRDAPAGAAMAGAFPAMHLPWGVGFVLGLVIDPLAAAVGRYTR